MLLFHAPRGNARDTNHLLSECMEELLGGISICAARISERGGEGLEGGRALSARAVREPKFNGQETSSPRRELPQGTHRYVVLSTMTAFHVLVCCTPRCFRNLHEIGLRGPPWPTKSNLAIMRNDAPANANYRETSSQLTANQRSI